MADWKKIVAHENELRTQIDSIIKELATNCSQLPSEVVSGTHELKKD